MPAAGLSPAGGSVAQQACGHHFMLAAGFTPSSRASWPTGYACGRLSMPISGPVGYQ